MKNSLVLSLEDIEKMAGMWISAFNTQDIEALLLLYSDYAEHCSLNLRVRQPETGGLIQGKQNLREWWTNAFARLPTLHYRLIRFTEPNHRIEVPHRYLYFPIAYLC